MGGWLKEEKDFRGIVAIEKHNDKRNGVGGGYDSFIKYARHKIALVVLFLFSSEFVYEYCTRRNAFLIRL